MREVDDIECVFESMTPRGSIYISNFSAAQNVALLESKGIKAILSVARSGLLAHRKEDVPYYLYIPMEDHQQFQISKYFASTFEFIEQARRESNVLIHCMVGVSRSVTIAIAYLLRKYQYTLGQVISLIQRRRRKINPNPGFLQQLQKYSETLGIKCDFYQKKVPPVRESSASKQVRAYSLRKQRTPMKVAQPLTPIPYVDRDKQQEKSPFLPLNFSQDLKTNGIKTPGLDLKKIRSYEEKDKAQDEGLKQVNLKKSMSIEEGKGQRRPSIEEKISKIRQKILNDHLPDNRQREGRLNSKDHSHNERRNDLGDKKLRIGDVSPSTRHSHAFPKPEQKAFRGNRTDMGLMQGNHLHSYLREQQNREMFSSELKIESKAFYSHGCRQNPRFSRVKEEIAH